MLVRLAVPAALAVLTLGGCSGSAQDAEVTQPSGPSPASEPSAVPTSQASAPSTGFPSVVELRDAAVDAGLPCPRWRQTDRYEVAAEYAKCSGSTTLSTYSTRADLQEALATLRTLNLPLGEEATPLLVGENWIIQSPHAPKIADRLGGVVEY